MYLDNPMVHCIKANIKKAIELYLNFQVLFIVNLLEMDDLRL